MDLFLPSHLVIFRAANAEDLMTFPAYLPVPNLFTRRILAGAVNSRGEGMIFNPYFPPRASFFKGPWRGREAPQSIKKENGFENIRFRILFTRG